MKRVLIIAVCFSILYAGAAWAFAGCESLIAAAAGHEHGDDSDGHHHDAGDAPRHADTEKIHCPNLFGAFVIDSRAAFEPSPRLSAYIDYQLLDLASVFRSSASRWFDLGPPGPAISQRPLRLLLSVIRI